MITDIPVVGVDVTDQDAALDFFAHTLGFGVRFDADTPAGRWLVVAPSEASTAVALVANPSGVGHDTGIRYGTANAGAAHRHLADLGVTVGELLEWEGTPPMFSFQDPDGNSYYIVEDWS